MNTPKGRKNMLVSPSMLSADFSELSAECKRMKNCGCDWLHLDIIDGVFAPNITFGIPVIKSIRKHSDLVFDLHLMIKEPLKYIEDFAQAGADFITFHLECDSDIEQTIDKIHSLGLKAGIALKPKTPAQAVIPYIDKADMILVMTVEPGFSGQSFMSDMMPKLKKISELCEGKNKYIQVDGGISEKNIALVAENGANVAVSGSTIFCAENPKAVVEFFHSF